MDLKTLLFEEQSNLVCCLFNTQNEGFMRSDIVIILFNNVLADWELVYIFAE